MLNKIHHCLRNIYRKARLVLKIILKREVYIPVQKKIDKEYLGSAEYGGWYIHPNILDKKSLIYSFGIGEDISFDLDLIKKFGCRVYAFDPTPKSLKWLEKQKLPPEFFYYDYGIGNYDGQAKFFPPKNPKHVSHSMIPKNNSKNKPIKVQVYKLQSILNKIGHQEIDLLKMDIEGAEYKVLENILKSKIKIRQILVEFHHRFPRVSPMQTKNIIKKLNNYGYKIFAVSPSREEYSFIKTNR